jgi:hypothetical protein
MERQAYSKHCTNGIYAAIEIARCGRLIFGWKPNPRSRWKRAASNGLLWFAMLDVIALLSL